MGFAVDVPRESQQESSFWSDWGRSLRSPSFLILVLQGGFGVAQFEGMRYIVEWCQYIGYSDTAAGAVVAIGLTGVVLGCFLGGAVSDWACEKSPTHGRIYV